MNIALSPDAPEIWSRETGSAVPCRVSLLISILRLNSVLTCGVPPEFRGGIHLCIDILIVSQTIPTVYKTYCVG